MINKMVDENHLSPEDSIISGEDKTKRKKHKKAKKNGNNLINDEGRWFRCMSKDSTTSSVATTCLWTACRAVTVGIFLILIGAAMATVGFYAKVLSTSADQRGNVTVFVTDEDKFFHLDNLTYVGPCVMGIGGVIIVGACVMTFEARDTAAKIVPWFRLPSWASTTRYCKVEFRPPPGIITLHDGRIGNPELEAAKMRLKLELMQFRDKVQNNMEGTEMSVRPKAGQLTRSNTEPNLAADGKQKTCQPKDVSHSLAPKITQDSHNTLRVSQLQHKFLCRQAHSVDYNPEFPPVHRSHSNNSASQNCHMRGDSGDSMVMDLYLPQGSVTLKIRDTSKSGGSSLSLQRVRTSSVSSQENRRSVSPGPLACHSGGGSSQRLANSGMSPNSEEVGLLTVPSAGYRNKLRFEKSHSSDSGIRTSPRSPIPKQQLMVQGKSQSSDDGYLRVPNAAAKIVADHASVSRGSSVSSDESFRTPSPRPFNRLRLSAGSSISSEDGSLGRRNPNLSIQSGSYSSQESYTILESPRENIASLDYADDDDEERDEIETTSQGIGKKQSVRRFQSVQDQQRPCDQKMSDEGQRRVGQYWSKTESAKRHPFQRQAAIDS